MSSLLKHVSGYNNPEILDLRNSVQEKNDNIPFLLLPVKIETRFMEVDRAVLDFDTFPEVIERLFEIENKLRFDPRRLPLREVLGKIRNCGKYITETITKISEIKRLSGKDLQSIRLRLVQIEKANILLLKKLSKIPQKDFLVSASLKKIKKIHVQKVLLLSEIIEGLKVTCDAKFPEASVFLNKLDTISNGIQLLGAKKISTSKRKEKKEIFKFLDEEFINIKTVLASLKAEMNINMQADGEQVKGIKSFATTIYKQWNKVIGNLATIKSDYKKAEYEIQVKAIRAHIEAVCTDIKERVVPKIEMKNGLQIAQARDIIIQINVIRYKLKQLNEKAFENYNEIRNTRLKLYKLLHFLRATTHKIIEGTNEELSAIAKAWSNADAELEKFNKRVASYKGRDSVKSGLVRTVSHINSIYRKDMSGLKEGKKSSFTELSNKTLEKSAVAFNSLTRKLSELQDEIKSAESNHNPEVFKAAMEKLVVYKSSFEIAVGKIHVMPAKSLRKITELSNNIERGIRTLHVAPVEETTGKLKESALDTIRAIKTEVGKQYRNDISRKHHFYNEERTPFVFARKTITRDELWVRFYPDDIAIHSHEEQLTKEEIEAGKAYWIEICFAYNDYDTKLAAWRAIATAHGSQRAAWIVKALTPIEKELPTLQQKIKNISKNSIQINSSLEQIIDTIQKSGKDVVRQFDALTVIYSYLIPIEKQIRNIKADNPVTLKQTQKLLLKVQSWLSGLIKQLEKNPGAKRDWTDRRVIVQQVIEMFNNIIQCFSGIDKLNAKELFKNGDILDIVFPEVESKEQSWTIAPHSKVMPDKFVVVAMDSKGGYKYIVPAKPINKELVVGLDPKTFDNEKTFSYDSDGNMMVDESIKWLTDFEEAEEKGMAVHFQVDDDDLADGFKKIFVIGVKGSNAVEGKKLLEQLIDNHHYLPEGASFLPVGTPTNNTENGESGYRSFEDDHVASFRVERNNEEPLVKTDANFPSDSDRLAEGLGIDPNSFKFFDYRERTEVSEALNMNKALFNGTLGNFMEEGLDQLFTLDNIDSTKDFMTNYVTARGYLPTIRIGTQPYGILPCTAFSKFHATENDENIPILDKEDFESGADITDELKIRYDIRLNKLLEKMNSVWTNLREIESQKTEGSQGYNPQAHFMKMLGLQANSSEFHFRYGINVASRMAYDKNADFSINFSKNDLFRPSAVNNLFKGHMAQGYFYSSDQFSDEHSSELSEYNRIIKKLNRIATQFSTARVFKTRYLSEQSQLLGDMIDSRELSNEIVPKSTDDAELTSKEIFDRKGELQHYIDWLLNRSAWDVHASNKFSEYNEKDDTIGAGMPSKSLLFLLLRHSLLSANADTILKILAHEKLISEKVRKKMGMPAYYFSHNASGFNYVTKWTYLFGKMDKLNGVLGNYFSSNNLFYQQKKDHFLNQYLWNCNKSNAPEFYDSHKKYLEELEQTKEAISKLKAIPTARLKQLMAEHLDLCTYRLDAWRLGMVNKRLSQQRKNTKHGIYIGAFGWVEDLNKGERTLAGNIPSGLWKNGDGGVYTDKDRKEFIHAPSLNHAITAAILRAGYKANKDTAAEGNRMAVNLSSSRVRMGLNLLHSIQEGKDAALILGYQFERGLHERYLHLGLELDKFIYDFRNEFPSRVPVDENTDEGQIHLNFVVDGMELLECAQDFIGHQHAGDSIYQNLKAAGDKWWEHVNNHNLIVASNEEKDVFIKEIDRMANAFDALGDLCVSESVYQVVQGNHVRASAIMDKLAKGDVPKEIQITNTPRTGTVVTHKVAVCFGTVANLDYKLTEDGATSVPVAGVELENIVTDNNARPAGWNCTFTPRAIAEPTINKWAGGLIGDPAKIKCTVSYCLGGVQDRTTISIADLNVQPMDVLHLMGTGSLDGGAELNARIANTVKSKIAVQVESGLTVDDADIHIKYTQRENNWDSDDSSFYEKAGFIQSIRKMITDSTPLAADTLLISGEEELEPNEVKNQIVEDYLTRATNLHARLKNLNSALNSFFSNEIAFSNVETHTFTDVQVNTLRTLLNQCASFGVSGTLPKTLTGFDNKIGKALLLTAHDACQSIVKRIDQAEKYLLLGADTTKSNDARIDAIRDAAKELLGKAFIMLPQFLLRKANDIADQLNFDKNKGLLRNAPGEAVDIWMQGLSRVRERIAGFDTMEMWAENFDVELPEKAVIQFPFEADEQNGIATDYWLGIEYPEEYVPTGDKLSLVIQNPLQLTSSDQIAKAGLLIDEWVEIIPNRNETTGITFNYDQPDAKAPNTLLMAVTPQQTGQWCWDDLVYTLNDTLEMVKNRSVEPEQLENSVFGQILPGIMNEIIPPQLLPKDDDDSGDARGNPMGRQVITDFRVGNDTYHEE